MEVSMTTFLDFMSKAGSPKITCVKSAKRQYAEEYSTAKDYYLPLRSAIVHMHANGEPASALDAVVKGAHLKKAENYRESVKAYKRWMRGKTIIRWQAPPSVSWTCNGLEVRVNPELALSVNGQRKIIKLYFKAEKLTATRISAGLHLIGSAIGPGSSPAVLEVRRGLLHEPGPTSVPGLDVLLQGEAAMFATLWNAL
jgi:hypothetical protein